MDKESSVLPSQNSSIPVAARHLAVTDSVTRDTSDIYPSQPQPTNDAGCDTKTDKKAFLGIGINAPINDENTEWF